jgi:WD40 repeat protein
LARARQYEAFISYSHQADNALATELQRVLNRIARPSYKWWQWWPPRVFRDQTNLAAATDLGGRIEDALLGSGAFVLLASPRAAASPWVDREVATWCAKKPVDRLFIALTEGNLDWNDASGDFDNARSTALPPALRGRFAQEPKWVDFTAVREDLPFARDPLFLDGAATLAAAIRETDKDALVGEDVRQRRRARQLAGGAIATLTLLAVLLGLAAAYAFVQRNHANERARLALSRQLAAQAVAALDLDPEQSLALAARAATTAPTDEAESALRRALRTSRLRAVIRADADVHDVDLDPSGELVAAALANGTVRTWSLRTRRPVGVHELAGELRSVSFNGDGTRLLGAGRAGAAVWAAAQSGRRPLAAFDREGQPFGAAWSEALAATADADGLVRLWRAETGTLERELRPPGRPSPMNAVAVSGDGSRLAAASGTRTIVWSLASRSAPVVMTHQAEVLAVAFSPDGRAVATGDDAGVARVWNLRTGAEAELNGHENAVSSVAFSPDGRSLVTASQDETARIWDLPSRRTRAELRGHNDLVLGAAFAADGRTVVTGGADGTVRVWAVEADPILTEFHVANGLRLRDVGFHPGGRFLVTAGEDGTARVWDRRSGRTVHVLRDGAGSNDWVESASFAPDGRHILTAGTDGTARLWDTAKGEPAATLGKPGDRPLLDAAMSPDGELVAGAGLDPVVRLWRWRQRRQVGERGGLGDRVDGIAFSPAGDLVATAGGRTVLLWPVEGGDPVRAFRDPDGENLTSVAFDPSGELVAAGSESGAAWIWSVDGERPVARAGTHADAVAGIGFSADGGYLVTAGGDGVAQVWSTRGGGLVTSLRTRARGLEAAAFAPHGRDVAVAVAGDGGLATVFACEQCRPLEELICLAGSRVTPQVRAQAPEVFRRCD